MPLYQATERRIKTRRFSPFHSDSPTDALEWAQNNVGGHNLPVLTQTTERGIWSVSEAYNGAYTLAVVLFDKSDALDYAQTYHAEEPEAREIGATFALILECLGNGLSLAEALTEALNGFPSLLTEEQPNR
jgi:hypothetical protein